MVDKSFFLEMIQAAKREQEQLRLSHAKQEGVIAFCEVVIKKMEEQEKPPA